MANSEHKLLPANVGIWIAYPEAFADPSNPQVAELNNTKMVFNESCAITQDYNLNQTASATQNGTTICDVAEREVMTSRNYQIELPFFRHENITDVNVNNTLWTLTRDRGVEYIVIKRLGKPQNETFASGDVISLYGGTTASLVDNISDGALLTSTATLNPNGFINPRFEVA